MEGSPGCSSFKKREICWGDQSNSSRATTSVHNLEWIVTFAVLGRRPRLSAARSASPSSIAAGTVIPCHLARDRRWRPANSNCNRSQRIRRSQTARDLLSLLQAERNSRPLPRPGSNPARLMDVVAERARVPPHVARDSGPRLTSRSTHPQLGHFGLGQGPLSRPVLSSLQGHLLLAAHHACFSMRCCVDPLSRPAKRAAFGSAGGAGDGNRTHVTSLEGWRTTIVLRPLARELVAHRGLWVRSAN